jgi:hypothetical protein
MGSNISIQRSFRRRVISISTRDSGMRFKVVLARDGEHAFNYRSPARCGFAGDGSVVDGFIHRALVEHGIPADSTFDEILAAIPKKDFEVKRETIRKLRSDGRTLPEIAAETGLSRTTVYRHVKAVRAGL